MSRTANSSKQRREASRASSAATGPIGSSPTTSPRLARLTPSMQAGVHVGHEAVEMRAPLGADLDRLEEEIHQHRLAAPDRAIDIEAARRLGRLQPHESGEGARPLILGAIALEPRGTAPRACRRGSPAQGRIRSDDRERARGIAPGGRSRESRHFGKSCQKPSLRGAQRRSNPRVRRERRRRPGLLPPAAVRGRRSDGGAGASNA